MKKIIFLSALIIFLALADYAILNGPWLLASAHSTKLPSWRPSAPLPVKIGKDSKDNIRIEEFDVSQEKPGLFSKGAAIQFSCLIRNDSPSSKKIKSLVRTSKKEIAAETRALASGEALSLKGSYTPEESGVVIVACRADVDQQISESDEKDNREIAALYIR